MPSYIANFWIAIDLEATDEDEAAALAEQELQDIIASGHLADHVNETPDIYPA